MAKLTKEVFIESLKEMTILEIKELVDAMKEEFGIDPTAVAAAPTAGAGAAAQAEQTEFDVVLTSAGAAKLGVIKVVKELTGLGLKEAKDLVDNAPKAVKENCPKAEAEEIANKLKEAGAVVELQ